MKIGLFFGSFDPIHIGHCLIAKMCLESQNFDEIWFIVSPHNLFKTPGARFKNPKELSTLSHRFQMVNLVCKDMGDKFKAIKAIDVEYKLSKPSYIADTLKYLNLNKTNADDIYELIIGSDSWLQFNKWKDWIYIYQNFHIWIYPRPGFIDIVPSFPTFAQLSIKVHKLLNIPVIDMSSTLIRERVIEGLSIQYMVPNIVEQYILHNKLYRK